MKLHVIDKIRQIVHEEEVTLETMAHDFEHQVDLLYGEGGEPEEGAAAAPPTEASPAARDAAKYTH